MPTTDAGTLARDDLSKGGKVAAERICIFVIDFTDVDLAEVTVAFDFFVGSHSEVARVDGTAVCVRDECLI